MKALAQHIVKQSKAAMIFIVSLFVFTFLVSNSIFGATITTAGSGNWNSTTANAPWPGGTVPALNDNVIIANGHTVTLTVAVTKTGGSVTVNQGGTLTCNAALTIGNLTNPDMTISGTVNIAVANGLTRSTNSSDVAVTATGTVNLTATAGTVSVRTWDFQTGSTVKLSAAGNQTLDADFIGANIDNLILSGSGTKTLGENTTVSQLLSIEGTATFANGGFTLTYGAAAVLQYLTTDAHTAGTEWITPFAATGGVIIGNTAGSVTMNAAKVFNSTAPLTINSGSTLAMSTFLLTLNGNLINNGGTTTGSGGVTITGTATQNIGSFSNTGTVSMTKTGGVATLTGNVNGGALTINGTGGTLNLGTGRTHIFTGAWTRTAGTLDGGSSILRIGGNVSGTGGTFTASTGTVDYNANGPQTAAILTYNNLTLSVAGAKTFATTPTVNGVLSLEGTATVAVTTGVVTYGTNATLQYNTTTSRTVTSQEWITPFVASGGVIIASTGIITMNEAKTFNANVPLTINSGAKLNTNNLQLTLGGNFTNNGGTFTAGSSAIVIGDVMTNQNIAGFSTTGLVTMSKTWGTATLLGAVNAGGLTIAGSGGTLNLGSNITHTITGDVSITGNTLLGGTNTTLNESGNWTMSGGVFTPETCTVNFNGVNQTLATTSTPFNNLTFSGGGTKTLNSSIIVSGTLTLTSGLVTLGANNLTLSTTSPAITGTFSATNMIVTNSTGELRRSLTTNGTYLFPVGEITGTTQYSPITIIMNTGTYDGGAYISARVTNAKHPNNSSVTNYLNRYWSTSQTGVSSFLANVTATYLSADIAGAEGNQVGAKYNGTLPWIKYSTLASNTFTCNGINSFGDFTGINNLPTIATSVSSLTGFSYPVGYGPSGEQTFTVSGTDLSANITVTPSTNFEISTTSGSGFGSIPIVLAAASGAVATTTIYIRMKTGIALGAVAAENTSCTTTGATTKNVACSGTVVTAPNIVTSVSTLTGLNYVYTAGPSAQQSFTVSGTNLVANVNVTPPTNFEISTLSGANFVATNPIVLTQSGGNLAATTIYTRLKIALGVGSYTQNIVASSTAAANKNVSCSGTVAAAPTILTSSTFLGGFMYTTGTGPSPEQSFTVTGSTLSANVIVTPPTNFEISTTSGSGFISTAITLTQSGGNVNATIYVRLKSALAVNTYAAANISITSTGAAGKAVACSGAVVNVATILSSKSFLSGFGYLFSAGGPSTEQMMTVSGASLTANIIVTPPTNYEISLTSGSGFQSTAITLTQTGGKVNPTKIYTRLKSGLAAGNYAGVNITLASTGATTQNISIVGIVFISPLITAGGGGDYCEGGTINLTSVGADIQNRYWQGPNSFFTNLQNPTITNATTAMSGTYSVTGNVTVGGNLVVNGDFEAGNTSFGSGYGYVAPTANALWPEALYTVVASPATVHNNFSACADHTPAPGTLQMVINGAPTAGVVIWTQAVPVIPNADYEFTYWVQTVVAESPSKLQLYANGIAVGPVYTADLTTCTWKQFVYNTNAGSNTTLNLELINQNTATSGNDFALDDIVFQQILPANSSVNVVVNPILPVSVSVVASANPVYTGAPVTYTATPTNGGTTPAYQWQVNGINVGTNSPTYEYVPHDGDVVKCILTSSYPCVTNNPANASVIMTVIPRVNYWYGYIDTDWGKPGNWTANYVPYTGDDVEYATVANFGSTAINDLWLDVDRTIGSLINATTKRLVIPAGLGLLVNNTISTDGNVDRIYIYSNSSIENGSIIFHNSVNSPVQATVEMYSKAWWDLNQVQGNRYNWQYFGIPLRSVVAEPTFVGSYVRKWYETGTTISNHWIKQENNSVLVPFYGYELVQQAPKTFYFQGTLENGDFNSGQLAITSGALYPGQHVFANPYTAAIDIRQLTFGTQTEASVYLYHCGTYNAWLSGGETTPGTSPGQYIAIPKNTAGYGQLPRQVPSMQAMLVKAMSNSSQATFAIDYNAVHMFNTDLQRAKASNDVQAIKKMSTMIDIKGAHSADRMWIFSDSICTNSFDNGYDGFKLLGSPLTPQIFAIGADGEYQVSAVNDMNNTELGFQAGQDSEYTLTFTHENVESKYSGIYLVDLVENKTIDITASGSKYTFVSEPTASTVKRFKIVTNYYEIKDKESEIKQIKIFNANGSVFIQNLTSESGELLIYNMSGRFVKRVNFSGNCLTIVEQNLSPGAYVATVVTNSDQFSKRIIVR